MGGLSGFERRWSNWLRMRDAMHWRAYDAAQTARVKRLASWGLHAVTVVLAFICIAAVSALLGFVTAHAQQPPDAQRYRSQLTREARLVWGLDAPVPVFAAQIHRESRWNADARSRVGAQGLAQFMPSTATWLSGVYRSLGDATPTNPTWAIRALVTYDAHLATSIKRADDDCQRVAFALSAYNGGLGWVLKRQARSPTPGVCIGATCRINPGISASNQAENQRYPELILLRWQPLYATWGRTLCG